MNTEEYRNKLHEDIEIAAVVDITNPQDEFLKIVTEILINGDEFDDFKECYYEGVSKRGANMRIDGYTIDETDGSCCVFITDYHGRYESSSVNADEITDFFRRIWYFINEASKYELYKELEESTEAYDFAKKIFNNIGNITKFRFYLLTDAYNNQRKKNIKELKLQNMMVSSVADVPLELNIWDIDRIYNIVSSRTQKESIEISLADFGFSSGIPCVKAVEYNDAIADIEVIPKMEDALNIQQEEKPANLITYKSYLAVVPGQFLNDIYLEYGSRLLEGNVRSFLSAKGKVNRNIQSTIKNYPEMFFAYNNGIAATATELDTEMTENGLVITRVKDLQIVNGGQTTASIANTLLTARKDEIINLANLYVPMKISVLEQSMAERIIPKISEYSNSQNKVDESDFFSNHPFHIRMQDFSKKIPAPAVNGNQYQQYWYYERARGQYNQEKMKFKPKSSQMKQYEMRYPENQVIKMVDLAKYMEIYAGAPDIVSKGKQAIVRNFANQIKNQWKISNIEFNEYYFKRMVALAIMFRDTDNIIKSTQWYKNKHSYKANVIAYTLSIILNYVKVNCKGQINFIEIWNKQKLYKELYNQISILCEDVYNFITDDSRLTENVTEWCKKEECWKRAKKQEWNILPEFIETLIPDEEVVSKIKEYKITQKIKNNVDLYNEMIALGSSYWQMVYDWGIKENKFSGTVEKKIIQILINMDKTGESPNEGQVRIASNLRKHFINEGMPMQFKV